MPSSKEGRIPSLAKAEWLNRPATAKVFAALEAEGAEARIVGGAVRNALMGLPVKDVDMATTALPADVMRLATAAGLHAIPTGIEHGTVTVVAEHVPIEVTTLRRDIETFGRHARVTFTDDWSEDARRRDFTMNALYCDFRRHGGGSARRIPGPRRAARALHRQCKGAHPRGLSAHPALLPLLRAATIRHPRPTPKGSTPRSRRRRGWRSFRASASARSCSCCSLRPRAVEAARTMQEAGLIAPLIGVAGDVEPAGAPGRHRDVARPRSPIRCCGSPPWRPAPSPRPCSRS